MIVDYIHLLCIYECLNPAKQQEEDGALSASDKAAKFSETPDSSVPGIAGMNMWHTSDAPDRGCSG